IFIVGDIVEGAGIYPDQEEDLEIKNITKQYEEVAKYLSMFPKHMKIFLCAGNHDAVRLSEPQPIFDKDFAAPLYNLKNIEFVSNPSLISIEVSKDSSGIDVLLYHGYSFPYYADTVESIRTTGGLTRTDLIMKYLLKRRHLAPTHGSTLYMPNYDKDPLLIGKVPDIFVTGHVHRTKVETYRSVTLLNCSCWLGQTKYQEKVGLKPEPGRVIAINLQTRKPKIINFMGA
ncbi:metallophosphoesterase, partial [Candidatus Woesearchaeota archaeon]|nr:metallophosphoesterase [Candidatus Woesearchaeota archaeon]